MGLDIMISEANNSDLDSIMKIENLCFDSDGFSRRQIKYLINKAKGAFYVLRFQGKISAYISLLTHKNTSNLRIYSIAVHPDDRGKKLAQKLLEKSISYAKNQGLSTVALEVKTNNSQAIGLYKKHGFKIYSKRHNYYNDGSDAYVMILELIN